MKNTQKSALLISLISLIIFSGKLIVKAESLGTSIDYKCKVMDAHGPVNGFYDLDFTLFNSPDPNTRTQIGNKIITNNVEVTNGFLSVDLDFIPGDPNVFNGDARWIETVGWPTGTLPDEFNVVSNLEEIKPVPYSLLSRGIFVDANRNVGIGTTKPSVALDVNGILKLGSDTKSLMFFTDGTGEDIRSTNTLYINYNNNKNVAIGYSGNSNLTVSGNVGIGISYPSDKLHVAGSALFDFGSSSVSISTPGSWPGIIAFSPNGNQRNILFDDSSIRLLTSSSSSSPSTYNGITINEDGNVGIGTINPQDKLHVAGLARFDLGGGRISMSTPGGWPGMIAFSQNGHRRDIVFDDSTIRLLVSGSSSPTTADNGITINEDGNVGIGTNYPENFKLAVNGSAAKPGGGSWSTFSDIRLKNVGANFERGLAEVSELNPIWYNYEKDNELHLEAATKYVGVVAQEVQKVIPEAVEKSDTGYLTINNDPIIWAMVNAIKELKAENEQLKRKVEDMEKKLQ